MTVLVLAFKGLEETGPSKNDEPVNCDGGESKCWKGNQKDCSYKRPQDLACNHGLSPTSMFVGWSYTFTGRRRRLRREYATRSKPCWLR